MSEDKSLISFQSAAVRPRHDGWTAEKQIAFIEKLADCVRTAARPVAATVGNANEAWPSAPDMTAAAARARTFSFAAFCCVSRFRSPIVPHEQMVYILVPTRARPRLFERIDRLQWKLLV